MKSIVLVEHHRRVRRSGYPIMALTLEAEQRLENVGLVALFIKRKSAWLALARQIKTFVRSNFPNGSKIRRDDVAKAFFQILST